MATDAPLSTHPSHRTRNLALVLVALVVVSLLGLDVWQSWNARDLAIHNAAQTAQNLARSLAEHAGASMEEADTVLSDLIERVQHDGVQGAQGTRLRGLMRNSTRDLPQLHGLFIYDRDGRWLVSSNVQDPPGANNADREYFHYHRSHTDPGPHLGPVIQSRSDGALIIPLSRRIDAPDGSFAGVALATLEVKYFNDFYQRFELDPLGVITLALGDGTILARRPFDPKSVGTSLAQSHVFTTLLPQAPGGAGMFASVVDQVVRMFGFQKVDGYPLVTIAAQPRSAVLAGWYANLWRTAGFVAVLLILLAVFTVLLLRQLRHSAQTDAELRNAHAALQKLAMQDSLTGLGNRRQLDLTLPHEIGRARRGQRPLGLVMLDIDHFKRYNDLYGHPAGDTCIRSVGQAVLGCVNRAGDLVVRYGGEEFLVVLPECDLAGTLRVAQRIVETVRALGIPHSGNAPAHCVTVSAGVHIWQSHEAARPQALIEAADAALYQAKHAGRNQVGMLAGPRVMPPRSASTPARPR